MTDSTPGGVPEYPDDAADQPSDADYAGRLERAALLRTMGQPDRAVEEAGRLCVDFPDSPQAHLELALVLLEAERVDEARREAHEALALDPGNAWATFLSAELTPSFSLFKRRSLMRRVVELDPDSGVALARLALLERHCGAGRRRCRKLAERALDAEPYNPSVYVAVAELELSLDNVRRARARVSEALSLSPDHAGALALQAKLASSTKQIREARTALSSALAVDPTDSRLASGVHELGHKFYDPLTWGIACMDMLILVFTWPAVRPNHSTAPDLIASNNYFLIPVLEFIWLVCGGFLCRRAMRTLRGLGEQRAAVMAAYRRAHPTAVPVAIAAVLGAAVQVVLCIMVRRLDVAWWAAAAALALILTVTAVAFWRRSRQ